MGGSLRQGPPEDFDLFHGFTSLFCAHAGRTPGAFGAKAVDKETVFPYSGAEADGAFAHRTFTYLRSHQTAYGNHGPAAASILDSQRAAR